MAFSVSYVFTISGYVKPMLSMICCGCNGVLQKDGTSQLWNPQVSKPNAASYANVKEIEEFARKHGWMAVDDNHRCPACYECSSGRRGRIVPTSEVLF